jgi:hypothetical protein
MKKTQTEFFIFPSLDCKLPLCPRISKAQSYQLSFHEALNAKLICLVK